MPSPLYQWLMRSWKHLLANCIFVSAMASTMLLSLSATLQLTLVLNLCAGAYKYIVGPVLAQRQQERVAIQAMFDRAKRTKEEQLKACHHQRIQHQQQRQRRRPPPPPPPFYSQTVSATSSPPPEQTSSTTAAAIAAAAAVPVAF